MYINIDNPLNKFNGLRRKRIANPREVQDWMSQDPFKRGRVIRLKSIGDVAALGTWKDISGVGNDGTCVADAFVNNQGVNIDGTGDYVSHDTLAVLMRGLSAFTVSFWAKAPSYETNPLAFLFQTDSDANTALAIYSHDDDNGNGVRVFYNGATIIDEDGASRTGQWDLYTFVSYSSTDHVFYVNSAPVGTSSTSKTLASDLNIASTGGYAGTVTQYMNGNIDDMQVYTRSTSDDEINRYYNQNKGYYL